MTTLRRRAALAGTVFVLGLSGTAPQAARASAGTALPIPNPLTGNWTAPAGTYTMPKSVLVRSTVTVNLSAAVITGSSNYLFTLQDGGRLTVVGGRLSGAMQGLVLDAVTDAGGGAVTVTGTTLTDVRSVVFSKGQGGPIDVRLTGVSASRLGAGVRAVANALVVRNCVLTGGGVPPAGYPSGLHSLDDNAGNVALAASYLDVYDSTITNFTSAEFQGDSIVGETRVGSAHIENNVLGHNSDSGGVDSKIANATFVGNTVYSDGYRGIASHYGTLRASDNTIYQVATTPGGKVGQAYQATGTLIAADDTVVLASGALLAYATYTTRRDSGPASTYPRVGAISLTHVTDANGAPLTGPTQITSGPGYLPTIVVRPQHPSSVAAP
jgi:hypothetical protein